MDKLMFIVFVFLGVASFAAIILHILAGIVYDVGEIQKRRNFQSHPHSRRFRARPLVSIIVPVYNSADAVINTLESILSSFYRKYEVIVADDGSTDSTVKAVQAFMAAHPKKQIVLLVRRKHQGRGAALKASYKAYAQGQLIMVLDAGSTLQAGTLKHVAWQFAFGATDILIANNQPKPRKTIAGIILQFSQLARARSKKLTALLGIERPEGVSGTCYRREVFQKAQISVKGLGVHYASQAVISAPETLISRRGVWKPSMRRQKMFNAYWLLIRLFPLLWVALSSYFLYLALYFQTPGLYAVVWLWVSTLLFFLVLFAEPLKLAQRLRLVFFIPVMGILLNMVFILKTIYNIVSPMYRKLARRSAMAA